MILKISDNIQYTRWIIYPHEIEFVFKIESVWLILARFIYYYTKDLLITLQLYNLICFFS